MMGFSIAQTIVLAASVFVETEDFAEKGLREVDEVRVY